MYIFWEDEERREERGKERDRGEKYRERKKVDEKHLVQFNQSTSRPNSSLLLVMKELKTKALHFYFFIFLRKGILKIEKLITVNLKFTLSVVGTLLGKLKVR